MKEASTAAEAKAGQLEVAAVLVEEAVVAEKLAMAPRAVVVAATERVTLATKVAQLAVAAVVAREKEAGEAVAKVTEPAWGS